MILPIKCFVKYAQPPTFNSWTTKGIFHPIKMPGEKKKVHFQKSKLKKENNICLFGSLYLPESKVAHQFKKKNFSILWKKFSLTDAKKLHFEFSSAQQLHTNKLRLRIQNFKIRLKAVFFSKANRTSMQCYLYDTSYIS